MVFQVLLGRLFFQDYYDENQWKINQRTNVNTGEKQDFSQIETWSKLDFKIILPNIFLKFQKQDAALQKSRFQNMQKFLMETEDIAYFLVF